MNMPAMKNELTEAQRLARDIENCDVIVSAGAGSGKTTVLTERLVRKIAEGNDINDYLVVTFMRSAAADMKSKLYKKLSRLSALNPSDMHIRNQITRVPEANICTISAYCYELVKENFALLGLPPHAAILDEVESAEMLSDIANELIARGYASGDKGFALLADNFSARKDDKRLAEEMLSLYYHLSALDDPFGLLLECARNYERDAETIEKSGVFAVPAAARLRRAFEADLDSLRERMYKWFSDVAGLNIDTLTKNAGDIASEFDEAVKECLCCNYVNLAGKRFVSKITFRKKDLPQEYTERAEELADEKGRIFKALNNSVAAMNFGPEAFVAEKTRECAAVVRAVSDFIKKLSETYEAEKKRRCRIDFSGCERMALRLLETRNDCGERVPTELCLYLRTRFKEILIDEYQDVNPMQDRIFTLLSGGGSRFMVGDVKQSIYRFRNAYPDIFLGYRNKYKSAAPGADLRQYRGGNACVLLNENFRCDKPIIDYVNHMFERLTADTPYASEFADKLIFRKSAGGRMYPVVVAAAEEPEYPEEGENPRVLANRAEAEYIACEIERLMAEDCSGDGSRFTYSDFAVLFSVTHGRTAELEKAFARHGIPYKSESDESFVGNPEMLLAYSALCAIDDPTDDISLCALMRSPICNFDSDELYRIRLGQKGRTLWGSVNACTIPAINKRQHGARFRVKSKSAGSRSLCAKCRAFVKRVCEWRFESAGRSASEFLQGFFISSGLYRICAATGGTRNLMRLYSYAVASDGTSYKGLGGFTVYLRRIFSPDKKTKSAAGTGDSDCVTIATVHKSKGLEFKVCFVAGGRERIARGKKESGITPVRREGICFRLRSVHGRTFYRTLHSASAAQAEVEAERGEDLRKLYVALTRAKERLYITGTVGHGEMGDVLPPRKCTCWMEYALYVASCGEKGFFDVRRIPDFRGGAAFAARRDAVIEPTSEMLSAAEFVYPYESAVSAPAKISVSELREGLLEDDEYERSRLSVPVSRVSARPSFADPGADAADIGTANHVFMQFCDFASVEQNGISAEADRLEKTGMITSKQRGMLDEKALGVFFESELYKEMRASMGLYREKRFSVRDKMPGSGETVLVQGVIDCFFAAANGSFTVVDYKTDRVSGPELVRRHRVQLACYCRAVSGMTGKPVSRALLWSFALGREVEVQL